MQIELLTLSILCRNCWRRECDSLGILRVSSSFYRHALVYFMAELGVIKFALSSLFPSLSSVGRGRPLSSLVRLLPHLRHLLSRCDVVVLPASLFVSAKSPHLSLSLSLCSISLIQIPNSTDRAALKGANSPNTHDIIYLCKCPLSHVPTHYYTTAFPSFHLDTEVHAFLSAKMYAIGMIELSLDVVSMLLNPLQACLTIPLLESNLNENCKPPSLAKRRCTF